MKKKLRLLTILCIYILFFLGMILYTGSLWYAKNYANVPFSQVLYHILSPIEGSDTGFLNGIAQDCFPIPITILITVIFIHLIYTKQFKKEIPKKTFLSSFLVSICIFSFGLVSLLSNMKMDEYIENTSSTQTNIYETSYVDPATISYQFPKEKRNLIYIFMESMEVTFESKKTGGIVEDDRIPEMTKLQEENDSFNGGNPLYNGYVVPSLSGWTVAGIVGQTCATPINIDWSLKNNITDGDFLSNAVSIGDILDQNGYFQEFMCGSEIAFGGRENYLNQHGKYTIFDYNIAKEKGKISENYGVWWGFEDAKLYEFAKSELNEISKNDKPFNLTLLTADTHFPNGYMCSQCENKFDEQYSNVMACASKQVDAFVKWCQEQDWYENTTIVIAGDHTTMDSNWFEGKDTKDYERKAFYTIINSPIQVQNKEGRKACTYDLFPTTLAALNVKFDSDRLGFGTNLYGSQTTILEEMDFDTFNQEIQKNSDYYTNYLFGGRDIKKDLEGTNMAAWSMHDESNEEDTSEDMLPQFYTEPIYYQTWQPVQEPVYIPPQPETPVETPVEVPIETPEIIQEPIVEPSAPIVEIPIETPETE